MSKKESALHIDEESKEGSQTGDESPFNGAAQEAAISEMIMKLEQQRIDSDLAARVGAKAKYPAGGIRSQANTMSSLGSLVTYGPPSSFHKRSVSIGANVAHMNPLYQDFVR